MTNECFRAWRQGRFQFRPRVEAVLHAAQRKIAKLLGDAPSLSDIRPRFGPGANTQVQKKNACPVTKLERVPSCSANFVNPEEAFRSLPYGSLPSEDWQLEILADDDVTKWRQVDYEIHVALLEFANKNAKIKRVIVKEPSLNGLYQLGLGDDMARRYKAGTCNDIKDRTRNQRAARYGSISGAVATLDMSSASDTQALGLVDHLYSYDWVQLFERLRSHRAVLRDGKGVVLETFTFEKISSMGNGFTFPLECITFWAIAEAVSDQVLGKRRTRPVLVYGDDIIVETAVAEPLMSVLRDLGFLPNQDKSFWKAEFRESCGADYVFGTNVRPVYVEEPFGSTMFTLHNFFVARGFLALARICEEVIHPSIRTRGPAGYGDGHLHAAYWVSRPSGGKKGWSGFSFETWSYDPVVLRKEVQDRILTPPRGRKDSLLQRREFHPGVAVFVRRLASYVAYRGEGVRHPGQRYNPYRDRVMPDADSPVASVWETPGKGPLTRAKVYTFEHPRLN